MNVWWEKIWKLQIDKTIRCHYNVVQHTTILNAVIHVLMWNMDQTLSWQNTAHGPLARYVNLRVAYASGMSGTFFPPPQPSDPDMHQGTCVTYAPWCMPWSLTGGFLWSWWWGKRSWHSQRMRNAQFYVSGKRPIVRPHGRVVIAFTTADSKDHTRMMINVHSTKNDKK